MPNPQVNPKDAALRFAFFSALNFTKPNITTKCNQIGIVLGLPKSRRKIRTGIATNVGRKRNLAGRLRQ